MNPLPTTDRRGFLARLALAGIGVAGASFSPAGRTAQPGGHAMRLCLSPGSIGVRANQTETIALAHQHGFTAVEPFPDFLAGLSSEQVAELRAELDGKRLVWGAAGLPVEFRRDDGTFSEGLSRLPSLAAALQRAGASRVGTWLSPGHGSLTYRQNFDQHARRLREVSRVLADHGLQLGLEYVGTFTSRARQRFPFVHNLAEARELIAAIGGEKTGWYSIAGTGGRRATPRRTCLR
ncbi:MAG: sugar phosphate isomerase/epimerase [Verrucomicrobia bacterium]|nr:sugar phosphate isomerase/epimerase [Verrucomicrobiota bacterium]